MLTSRRFRFARPSASLVISVIALIVSLAGTGFAAGVLPVSSVDTEHIRTQAVTGPKLKTNSVTTFKVANRSLRAVDFAPGQLPAGEKGEKGDTGAAGAPGTALAYAHTDGGTTPAITAGASKNITAITHAGTTGTYCVTPAAGINPAARPAVVSTEPTTALFETYALVSSRGNQPGCAANDYLVETLRLQVEALGGPGRFDDVPFTILVP